jgi:hypothetical protein
MLREDIEELKKPGSRAALLFRKRFRVPFRIFESLVSWTNQWLSREGHHETNASGIPAIPTSLKVLAVLRILGRASCADGIEELCGMSVPTTLKFLHRFCMYGRCLHNV